LSPLLCRIQRPTASTLSPYTTLFRSWQITNGDMHEFDVHPSDLDLPTANVESLLGGTPEHNAEVLRRTLAGEQGAVRDIVLFNADRQSTRLTSSHASSSYAVFCL